MGSVLTLAQTFLRPYVVDGVPGSGVNQPLKSDGLNAFAQIDAAFTDLALFSAIGVAYATLAALTADTTGAHPLGLVFNDGTPANDGIYLWTAGAPGSWSNTGITLPSTYAAAVTQLQAAVPWRATTWCSVAQLRTQLGVLGLYETVQDAIQDGPAGPVTSLWNHGMTCTVGGPLGLLVQSALGYSGGQMATLFANALALPF